MNTTLTKYYISSLLTLISCLNLSCKSKRFEFLTTGEFHGAALSTMTMLTLGGKEVPIPIYYLVTVSQEGDETNAYLQVIQMMYHDEKNSVSWGLAFGQPFNDNGYVQPKILKGKSDVELVDDLVHFKCKVYNYEYGDVSFEFTIPENLFEEGEISQNKIVCFDLNLRGGMISNDIKICNNIKYYREKMIEMYENFNNVKISESEKLKLITKEEM
jgi:hypothetical protein